MTVTVNINGVVNLNELEELIALKFSEIIDNSDFTLIDSKSAQAKLITDEDDST